MSTPFVQPPNNYSPEEIQEILHMAIARQNNPAEQLSRTQLWEIASELSIDNQSLQSAEQDWLSKRTLEARRQAFNAHRLQNLKHKTTKYFIVNGFLFGTNLLTGGVWWSLYVVLFWGLGLSLDAYDTFQSSGKDYEKAFEHWYVKQEIKESIGTFWQRFKKFW